MRSIWATASAAALGCYLSVAGTPAAGQVAVAPAKTTGFRPPAFGSVLPAPPDEASVAVGEHPLELALEFARNRAQHVHDHVRDFTCLLVRRERIDGRLRDYEYLWTRVRLQQTRDGRVTAPFSVFMQFLGPAALKDRKVLYVEGDNDDKMIVRNGGRRFSYVTVRIAPDSETALRESRYPITELSLETLARQMIEKVQDDLRYDPLAQNTQVTFFQGARVEGRPCTRVRVVHPERDVHFTFHVAEVYVDDELHVPIRVEGYDWPASGSDEPVLLEEYTFTRLRLNVGLQDSDFSRALVER